MALIRFLDIHDADPRQRLDAARILMAALNHAPSAWHDLDSARAEVDAFVREPRRLALLALTEGMIAGWVGALRHSQWAWELHPLVVAPDHQRRGVGSSLLTALENAARTEGVVSIWLGTDDDFGGTNLYGRNLYPDVLGHLLQLREVNRHPFRFYQRRGYSVTTVLPDVDGLGKHDILMAKRLSPAASPQRA